MSWNVWSCNTVTGEKLGLIHMESFSWSRVMNSKGSGRASYVLDGIIPRADLRNLFLEVARTLVLEWVDGTTNTGTVVYAGIIWGTDYDRPSHRLTIEHEDVWSFWARRHAVASNGNDVGQTKLTHTNLSLPTLAKRAVQEGTDAASPLYALPIVYPADVSGVHSDVWHGYHLPVVQDLLNDLMDEFGGPDIDFQPRWSPTTGRLEWVMRAGNLGGNSWEVMADAPKTNISGIGVKSDARKVTNNEFAIGEGMERDMLIRSNPNDASIYPALESQTAYKNATTEASLDRRIEETQRVYGSPTRQWSASLQVDGAPSVTALVLGGTFRVHIVDDPWLPDGWNDNRLIQIDGDLGRRMTLGFQTIGGA